MAPAQSKASPTSGLVTPQRARSRSKSSEPPKSPLNEPSSAAASVVTPALDVSDDWDDAPELLLEMAPLGESSGRAGGAIRVAIRQPKGCKRKLVSPDGALCNICAEPAPNEDSLLQIGSDAFPSWRCTPCHAAARRLDASCETNLERKDLTKTKRRNKEVYVLKVLELRHKHTKGVCQREDCQLLLENLTASTKQSEQLAVEMMDKGSFEAYQIYEKNYKDKTWIKSMWSELVSSASHHEIIDGITHVAVHRNKMYAFEKSVARNRVLQSVKQNCSSAEEKQDAKNRCLAGLKLGPGSSSFAAVGGGVMFSGQADFASKLGLQLGNGDAETGLFDDASSSAGDGSTATPAFRKSAASMSPSEKSLFVQQRIILRQAKVVELREAQFACAAAVKKLRAKIASKSVSALKDTDDFKTLNLDGELQKLELTITGLRAAEYTLKMAKQEDIDDATANSLEDLTLASQHVAGIDQIMQNITLIAKTHSLEARRAAKTSRLSEKQVHVSLLESGLSPEAYGSVPTALRDFIGSELGNKSAVPVSWDEVRFLDTCCVPMDPGGFVSAYLEAVKVKFPFVPTRLDILLRELDNGSTSLFFRFSAPKSGNVVHKQLADAESFTEATKKNVEMKKIGTPRFCEGAGLPWFIAVGPRSVASGIPSIPLLGLPHFFVAVKGDAALLVHAPFSDITALDFPSAVKTLSPARIGHLIRSQKIQTTRLDEASIVFVPAATNLYIINCSESPLVLMCVPHLSEHLVSDCSSFTKRYLPLQSQCIVAPAVKPHFQFLSKLGAIFP